MVIGSRALRALLVLTALGGSAMGAAAACVGTDRGDAASADADAMAADATFASPRVQAAQPAPGPASVERVHVADPAGNFAAGSLIIPMDVTYQDSGMLKAFGLLDKLLRAGVPVYWIIDPNKTVVNAATGTFTVDMTASATDFKTGAAISSYGYRGGPFVIDASNAAQAHPIIQAWQTANVTTVHVASAAFTAPVAKTLTIAPRIAVLNDGNQGIAFSYLNAAGVLDENNQVWSNTSADLLADTAVTGTLANPQDGGVWILT